MQNALIAMLRRPKEAYWRYKLQEFKRLSIAAGYNVVGEIIQVKKAPKAATLFGRGKIEEIKKVIEEKGVDVLLVYNTLKSIQKMNLELMTGVRVLDRYDLTLEIFVQNATDAVSKLQIELARISKEIPYIRLITALKHRKDRPFIRAGGEYGWSPKVAELRRRMKKIRLEIQKHREEKIRLIFERKEKGFVLACITGYYNAGKTTLFNSLTYENKPVSDLPFTTLSSKYSRLQNSQKLLLIDTIGFVIDLDPRIIKSFEINIEDLRYSDILILTIDASDPLDWLQIKTKTIMDYLIDIGALTSNKQILVALNKIDLLNDRFEIESRRNQVEEILMKYDLDGRFVIIPISAKKGINLESFVRELLDKASRIEVREIKGF